MSPPTRLEFSRSSKAGDSSNEQGLTPGSLVRSAPLVLRCDPSCRNHCRSERDSRPTLYGNPPGRATDRKGWIVREVQTAVPESHLSRRRARSRRSLRHRAAKMNCPRLGALRRYPRNGAPKRPINLEHSETVLVSCKSPTVGRRKAFTCNLQESTRREVAEDDPRRRQILS